ncbi:MAG: macro domain-containing protein [Deltaproteobacteria bacterium]|nr:macro domain-containing protein [Deltaproteobacteria bacterium]
MERSVKGHLLRLVQGDLTELEVEAIVNAANDQLILGGGVAGAIRTKGGPAIQAECNAIGHTPVGSAAITTGGQLKAAHVIHAVGPRWGEGDEEDKLKRAVVSSLKLADQHGLKTIALPAISTGIFGFPLDLAARVSLGAAWDYLSGPTGLEEVIFCLFGQDSYRAFEQALKDIAP